MIIRHSGAICAACLFLFTLTSCGRGADLEARCRAMSSGQFPGATISATAVVKDGKGLPGFCQVQGTIDPNIGFESRLPLSDWNGKYYQSGCGGYCGMVMPDKPGFSNTINEALKRGYATITTDSGHKGEIGDASWARGNPEAIEVYAHRGILLTYEAGTTLTRTFYESSPDRKYFGGCSNGGRMAAMAAQRYPTLFDGILGGGGVLNLSYSGGVYGSWVVQANTDGAGRRILTFENFAAKLPALEQAVMGQCDATDGKVDNVISLPRQCEIDVALLPACGDENTSQCFTDVETAVLEKWYQGPRNSAGDQLYPGMPAGSERYWQVWFLDREGQMAGGNQLGGRYAKYLGFEGGTPDDYTALDFDFDEDPPRLAATGALLDSLDPDLTEFRDAGGKYLMWHGWADPLVLPDQSLDYYEAVAAGMGGVDSIQSFYRLFMIPGQGHCWEIPARLPDQFDPITALDTWVETGAAPDSIPVHTLDEETAVLKEALLCPHPASAVSVRVGETASCVAD